MKELYVKRLRKLAIHLRHGKLGHKKFVFGTWNVDDHGYQIKGGKCGYAGCAIGECPVIFPMDWKFDRSSGLPILLKESTGESGKDAKKWFGLIEDEVFHLFCPESQLIGKYGGQILGYHANRHEVASNIEEFLIKKIKHAKSSR